MAPWIIVATVVPAAIAAAVVPVSFPAQNHGMAIQAPGSQGSLSHLPWWDRRGWFGGGAPTATRSRQVACHTPVPRDQ